MVVHNLQGVSALQSHRRRSILRRLWESYLTDLRDILSLYLDGELAYDDVQQSLGEIVPALKSLDENGELNRALERAEVVIVDRVLADMHAAPKGESPCSN